MRHAKNALLLEKTAIFLTKPQKINWLGCHLQQKQ
jgi:hypothetical protein